MSDYFGPRLTTWRMILGIGLGMSVYLAVYAAGPRAVMIAFSILCGFTGTTLIGDIQRARGAR